MTLTDLLHFILQRMDLNSDDALFVSADETADWPAGGVDMLMKWGMLSPAKPCHKLLCDGCEEQCIMPVEVVQKPKQGAERAFIACDKRDDIDIVPVEIDRLRQWKIDPGRIAVLLGRLLKLDETPQMIIQDRLWRLGMGQIAEARCEMFLARGVNWTNDDRILNEIDRRITSVESFLFIPNDTRRNDTHPHVNIISLIVALFGNDGQPMMDVKLLESTYRQNLQKSLSALNEAHQLQATQRFSILSNLHWGEVCMTFVSNDSIKLQARDICERYTFAEIGFKDRRKGDLPDSRWEVLRDDFAENEGEISFKNRKTQWDLKAAVKEINQRLRTIFPIQENPISYDKRGRAYKTKFKIIDKRYGQ